MKKRILACLLAAAMLVVAIPISASDSGVTLTIQTPEEPVLKGETFDITVEISNNSGLGSLQMTLAYDQSLMECNSIKPAALLRSMLSALNPSDENGAIIAAASASGAEGDGIIATYVFTAKEDVHTYDFSLVDVRLTSPTSEDIPYNESGLSSDGDEFEPEEEQKPEQKDPEEDASDIEDEELPSQPAVNVGGGSGVVDDAVDEKPAEEEKTESDDEDTLEWNDEEWNAIVHLFGDTKDHWAESYINKAAEAGLFKGDDQGNFNPDAYITRAQFITVLWRMAGSPKCESKTTFADVSEQSAEFQTAIAWGFENGYINGVSQTEFNPAGDLTREATMKILYYYAGGKNGNEILFTTVYDNAYQDSSEISDWARMPIYWGIYNKLISGVSETELSPQGVATRAQLAKILVDYQNTFMKQEVEYEK